MPPDTGHYRCRRSGNQWPTPCCCISCVQDEQMLERVEQPKAPLSDEWLQAEAMIEDNDWEGGTWPLGL